MRLPPAYRSETAVVSHCLSSLQGAVDWAAAAKQAAPWVQAVRDNPPPFWAMESLLKEYPISSAEGLALMRLAEALLRVPDVETAIALTTDQLGRADFDGSGDAVLARLSSAAIGMSKHFLPTDANTQPGLVAKLGARTVVAATLRAVALLGKQFVLGQTIGEAQKIARQSPGLTFSYDMLGEGARTERDAQHYLASYTDAIKSIAARAGNTGATASKDTKNNTAHSSPHTNDGISIKLSALHPRYEYTQQARVMAELVPRVWGLCELAARANINLTIDAEEVDRLELSLDVLEALIEKIAAHHPQWQGFGLAMQAYQSRSLDLIEHIIALARKHRIKLMCRLVKGAYWDAEVKRAQEMGLPHYPVFTHKHHTDVSYLACARALLAASDAVYPQFATHNAGTIAAILQMAARAPTLPAETRPHATPLRGSLPPEGARPSLGRPGAEPSIPQTPQFELQRLHGMGEGIYREVLKNPLVHCRIYAPVGAHRDLLAYLVRRLLENGANSSFVHQLADESVGMDTLLISPLRLDSSTSLPMPVALYGAARPNSLGIDLADESMRAPLLHALAHCSVPQVALFNDKLASSALNTCSSSYKIWSNLPVAQRAAILRTAADALQQQLPQFCALLVKEAFKTWGDAVSEVREAIDFLRYYANEAQRIMQPVSLPSHSDTAAVNATQSTAHHFHHAAGLTGETNTLRLKPRGVWVCISPWNFPLAIFMGQAAAALATGNTVLAKPAEQTPGVAQAAVALLHAAGVPADALQLCHGPGDTVGAALVALDGIAGVVFTGSTPVAKTINRALAAKDGPITPLIAETGGINAMVVDSSALPEQVCDAVIQSAFRSAGQRCSALRLLCVHEAIADNVIQMIAGAAQELVCGDSSHLATDVPRVIDTEAYDNILQHVQHLQHLQPLNLQKKQLLTQVNSAQAAINLVVPQMFEVASIADVKAEIFGPVLQVVRYGSRDSGDPLQVIEQINALGYGLTIGIQTRIDSRAQALAHAAHIGNVYINRSTIGAVVGVQPFGGEGLSGTGPKAGGPHYLLRFCAEQTVTVNTTAAGGNAALLAG